MKAPIIEGIHKAGQRYVDEPIYQTISNPKKIYVALSNAFNGMPKLSPVRVLTHYERAQLNWR